MSKRDRVPGLSGGPTGNASSGSTASAADVPLTEEQRALAAQLAAQIEAGGVAQAPLDEQAASTDAAPAHAAPDDIADAGDALGDMEDAARAAGAESLDAPPQVRPRHTFIVGDVSALEELYF